MDEIKDPLLEGREISITSPELPDLAVPKKFLSIPDNVFKVVIAYLRLTWKLKNDRGKDIPFDEVIKNSRFLFGGEGQYKDKLWKEHSAATLRELNYDLLPEDYRRAIKNIHNDEDDPQNGLFGQLYRIKLFLSDVVHFRQEAAVKQANKIFVNEDLSIKNFDEIYEMVCIELFYTLYRLYRKYAFDEKI